MKNAPNDTNFQPTQRVEITAYTTTWQKNLQDCISDVDELFQLLELPQQYKSGALKAHQLFPLKVPQRYLTLIEKGNINDPLLRQILPLDAESEVIEGYSSDPLQELRQMHSPGVIKKYQGRLLLTLTGTCAVNCRYCFRRLFPYSKANPSNQYWQSALERIQGDSSISEIILSGGDPLLLSDKKLASLINDLKSIEHLNTLRIHTRVPVFLPERINKDLLTLLQACPLKVVMVIHCNHPREIDLAVEQQLSALKQIGITLLNQAVLLKNVNDDAKTLVDLSQRLFEADVLPYYLHLLDKVNGAAHFDVPEEKAKQIYQQLLSSLPGYLVPKLVREAPDRPSKTPIWPF